MLCASIGSVWTHSTRGGVHNPCQFRLRQEQLRSATGKREAKTSEPRPKSEGVRVQRTQKDMQALHPPPDPGAGPPVLFIFGKGPRTPFTFWEGANGRSTLDLDFRASEPLQIEYKSRVIKHSCLPGRASPLSGPPSFDSAGHCFSCSGRSSCQCARDVRTSDLVVTGRQGAVMALTVIVA